MPAGRRGLFVPPVVSGGTWTAARYRFTKYRRIESPPIGRYTREDWGPIGQNTGFTFLDATGAGVVQLGPTGIGTRWRVTMAVVSTLTGPFDGSTAEVFIGANGSDSNQAAQSFAGGGSTAGLNDVIVYPGQFVICTWESGVAGDTATMVLYGQERNMVR